MRVCELTGNRCSNRFFERCLLNKVSCHTVFHHQVLHRAVPHHTVPCSKISCSNMSCHKISCSKMFLPNKRSIIAALLVCALLVCAMLACSATLVAQQRFVDEEIEIPFLYPDPRTVGVHPYLMRGRPAGAISVNRYAGVSEQERQERILWEQYIQELGLFVPEQPLCPLCVDDPMTPCRRCRLCVAGFPCERTLCRHCVQPRSRNMPSSCDLTAGDEPCGTCDSCREHRSDPCPHGNAGFGPRGEFNPYNEPRLFSVIPRPILDWHNNGARKFPVYYNPAPFYRPTWNPSTFTAYNRPFTFRWSCRLCYRTPCGCNEPGVAGQVSYAFSCRFCNRNPCACTAEICNVTRDLDPRRISQALAAMREEAELERLQLSDTPTTPPVLPTSALTPSAHTPPPLTPTDNNRGIPVDSLFEDAPPLLPGVGGAPEINEQVPPATPRLAPLHVPAPAG